MPRHFENELKDLKASLLAMAGQVEEMIALTREAYSERSDTKADQVSTLDQGVDQLELRLDQACIDLLALRAPFASDLRLIASTLKIVPTLERIGDHAVTIAESGMFLADQPPVKQLIDIPHMAEVVKTMIADSITSFINEDATLAKSVCERDDIVDGLRNQILRELVTYMTADPATIERSLQLMKISSNLERIADLATNICEDVIYMVKGKVIKHHKDSL